MWQHTLSTALWPYRKIVMIINMLVDRILILNKYNNY